MKTNKFPIKSRFGVLCLFFSGFIILSFIIRTVLLIKSYLFLDLNILILAKLYLTGVFFDISTAGYFVIPFVLYIIFTPDKFYQSRYHKLFIYFFVFLIIYILLFEAFAEYFFFDEFGVRFNFIAVDYLVYTNEVLQNIRQSYPVTPILILIAFVSVLIFMGLKKSLDHSIQAESNFINRTVKGFVFLIIPIFSFFFVDLSFSKISTNSYDNELSANGIFSLFSAFRNNRIDYETFYATLDNQTVFNNLRHLLSENNSSFIKDSIFDVSREIKNEGKELRKNVVVVVEESLSSDFLGCFGNKEGLTPNLDNLTKESLFFTNMFATGTRTDRGLEAITLSVPPTAGRSIVKRLNNENMFSWGSIMKEKSYDTRFIYGGYGYFDNMNYFYEHNGFEIIDRSNFKDSEICFENAWGVCDEDLFNKAIIEFNRSFKNNRPFFSIIMTTSNHRPYTYPPGRIDIPSHSGRQGAVKYADYSIGKLIRDAKKEPWFKDTIFVIIADHCASSAGKTSLPVRQYRIPCFVYSPEMIQPQKVDKLVSQIDVAPTILEILKFSYTTNFFGKDISKMSPEDERAFIGTYQKLGYFKENRLVILDVKKEISVNEVDRNNMDETKKKLPDKMLIDEAISYYQGANYLFEQHLKFVELK